jgi:hypothetical protein
MKMNGPKTVVRSAKTGEFVLTKSRGAKISAIEGLTLSPRMAETLAFGTRKGLTGNELRAAIKGHIGKK